MALTRRQKRERFWIGLAAFLAICVAFLIWDPTFEVSSRRYRAYQINCHDDHGLWGELVYVETTAKAMPWDHWKNVMSTERRPWLDRDSVNHMLPEIYGWKNGRLFSTGFKYQE